jgi:hypothetical protein
MGAHELGRDGKPEPRPARAGQALERLEQVARAFSGRPGPVSDTSITTTAGIQSCAGISRTSQLKRTKPPALSPAIQDHRHDCACDFGSSGQAHGCPVHFVLEEVHGIDSSRFQKVSKRLDTKEDQRRAASK